MYAAGVFWFIKQQNDNKCHLRPNLFMQHVMPTHRRPLTVYVNTALYLIHAIFTVSYVLSDALILALTDDQTNFELDLQSATAAQTDFVCVMFCVP